MRTRFRNCVPLQCTQRTRKLHMIDIRSRPSAAKRLRTLPTRYRLCLNHEDTNISCVCMCVCVYMYTFLFNEYPIIATFACIHRISEIQAKFHCKFHDGIFIRDIITTSRMFPFYFIMYVIMCCYHIVIVRN